MIDKNEHDPVFGDENWRLPQTGVFPVVDVAVWLNEPADLLRSVLTRYGYSVTVDDQLDMAELLHAIARDAQDEPRENEVE